MFNFAIVMQYRPTAQQALRADLGLRPLPLGRRLGPALIALGLAADALAAGTSGLPADAAAPAALGASSRVLDRALSAGISTGDSNLDLLLDAQRKLPGTLDEASVGKVPPRASTHRNPPAVLAEPARPVDSPAPAARPYADALPRQTLPGQVLDAPSQGGNPGARRAWSTGPAGPGGDSGFGLDPSAVVKSDPHLRDLVQRSVRFVKENIVEFLAAVLLVVALGAGLKAYSRRPD